MKVRCIGYKCSIFSKMFCKDDANADPNAEKLTKRFSNDLQMFMKLFIIDV